MDLPPGQRAVAGFPRFGIDLSGRPPSVPDAPTLEVRLPGGRRHDVGLPDLEDLPRTEVVADLHCVAGWSAVGLRWSGVSFAAFFDRVVLPDVGAATPRYLTFVGRDGYRSFVALEDALADGVLLADTLDGAPLTPEHGAPIRLVSPLQYGFVSTKHLCRIEVHEHQPRGRYHPAWRVEVALRAVRPHRRARVWHEERHRYVPSWLVRRIYRRLVAPPAPLLDAASSTRATGPVDRS